MDHQAQSMHMDDMVDGFDHKLQEYTEAFHVLQTQVDDTIASDKYTEYNECMQQIQHNLSKIRSSDMFIGFALQYQKHMTIGLLVYVPPATLGSSEVFRSALATYTDQLRTEFEAQKQQLVHHFRQEINIQQQTYEQQLRHRLAEETKQMVQQSEQTNRKAQQQVIQAQQQNEQSQKQLALEQQKVEECKNTIYQQTRHIADLQQELTTQSENTEKYTPITCQQIYKQEVGADLCINKDTYLDINTSNAGQTNFITKMVELKMKLPPIKGLHLNPLPANDLVVRQFLGESLPECLPRFALNYNTLNYTPLVFYKQEVASILPRVTKEVFINYLTISSRCLETIIKGSANSNRLVIRTSKVDVDDDLDFTGPVYKTSYISFAYTGDGNYSNWVAPWTAFRKIAEAMSKTSLKDSLNTVNVHTCTIGVADAQQILVDNGFNNVQVVTGNDTGPLKR